MSELDFEGDSHEVCLVRILSRMLIVISRGDVRMEFTYGTSFKQSLGLRKSKSASGARHEDNLAGQAE